MQNTLAQDRSVSGAYYILTGKQSIQTIQDTKLFHLESYYGIYHTLKKQAYMEHIDTLVATGFLQAEQEANHFKLTGKGQDFLYHHQTLLQQHFFQGIHYHSIDRIFHKRLLLLIQVWTNAQRNNATYIPVVDETAITSWVKQLYRQLQKPAIAYLNQLFKEISFAFEAFDMNDSLNIWVRQITGYNQIGWTKRQLATEFEKTAEDIHLLTTSVTHILLDQVYKHADKLTLLSQISIQESTTSRLTRSAQKTAEFLYSHTLEEIAEKRQLKLNTIYDHVVEISLYDTHFPLARFVPPSIQVEIEEAMKRSGSWKLKEIKANLSEEIRYFDIRLVLTHAQTYLDKGANESG